MRLKNKVALITGAANVIGIQVAETFAKEGAKVAITDRHSSQAELTAKSIQSMGKEALAFGMDSSEEEQVNTVINQVLKAFGGIDILIINAETQNMTSTKEPTYDEWKNVISNQLDGAYLTTRACFKAMVARETAGRIIYIGSVHSKEAALLKVPFMTANDGYMGLCQAFAKEGLQYQINANVIYPEFMRNSLKEHQNPERAKRFEVSTDEVIAKFMLKDYAGANKFTTELDVAETALFFATFSSQSLTGQALTISTQIE